MFTDWHCYDWKCTKYGCAVPLVCMDGRALDWRERCLNVWDPTRDASRHEVVLPITFTKPY